MNASTPLAILVIVVPLAAAIGAYVLLRGKDQPVAISGCAAIVIGVLISFAMTGLFFVTGWA